jgi:predicted Zn-dependent peptidase
MGRSILGSAEGIAGIGSETLRAYMHGQYRADRIVVAAAGRVDHGRFAADVAGLFDRLPSADDRARAAPDYRPGELLEDRDLEQLQLILGFDGVGYHDPRYFATQVLSTLLGGGMSSRLFQEVREKRGLAYAIHSFGSSYVDGGLFGVYAGCDGDQAGDLLDVLCEELRRIRDGAAGPEIARAKAQLKAGLLMGMESSSTRAEQLARNLLVFNRPIPTEEIVTRIDAVSEGEIAGIARELFRGDRLTLTALGPLDRVAAHHRLAARLG